MYISQNIYTKFLTVEFLDFIILLHLFSTF